MLHRIYYCCDWYNKEYCIFFYEKKDKKPNIFVCLTFFALIIGGFVFTFDNYFSLLVLLSSLISTFAIMQNSMLVLRISYIVCSLLLITNYAFTGLYTTIIAEGITLVSAIISLLRYHILVKKEPISENASGDEQVESNSTDTDITNS